MVNLINLLVVVMLVIGVSACTSHEEVIKTDSDETVGTSLIVKQIQSINDSILQNHINSRGMYKLTPTKAALLRADIEGEFIFGEMGCKIGAALGTICPGIGNIAGAYIGCFAGAVTGAIGFSYLKYLELGGCSYTIPNIDDIMDVYNQKENIDPAFGTCIDFDVNMLQFPVQLDSLENVGRYHNLALARLIKSNSAVAPVGEWGDENKPEEGIIDPGYQIPLSVFESSVIYSNEFEYNFNYYMNALVSGEFNRPEDDSIKNNIVNLYMDALGNYSGSEEIIDVVNLTNQYISVINSSNELSEKDKYQLYLSMSVGVYSYKFWTEFINDSNAEKID